MKDFFWNLFEKSGSIDAFMAYKEYDKRENKNDSHKGLNDFGGEING